MITILYIWTVVAAPTITSQWYDWRYMGEYSAPKACEEGARQLNLKNYRCVSNGGTK